MATQGGQLPGDVWAHVGGFLGALDAYALTTSVAGAGPALAERVRFAACPLGRDLLLSPASHAAESSYRHASALRGAAWTVRVVWRGQRHTAPLPKSCAVFFPYSLMVVAACPFLDERGGELSIEVAAGTVGTAGAVDGERLLFAREGVCVAAEDETTTLLESHRTSVHVYFDHEGALPARFRSSVQCWDGDGPEAAGAGSGVVVAHIRASEVEHALRGGGGARAGLVLPQEEGGPLPRTPVLPRYSGSWGRRRHGDVECAPRAIGVDVVAFTGEVPARAWGVLGGGGAAAQGGALRFRLTHSVGFARWVRRSVAEAGGTAACEPRFEHEAPSSAAPECASDGEMLDFVVLDDYGALLHSDCGLEVWREVQREERGLLIASSPFMTRVAELDPTGDALRILVDSGGEVWAELCFRAGGAPL